MTIQEKLQTSIKDWQKEVDFITSTQYVSSHKKGWAFGVNQVIKEIRRILSEERNEKT